jgi:hypothetical protein
MPSGRSFSPQKLCARFDISSQVWLAVAKLWRPRPNHYAATIYEGKVSPRALMRNHPSETLGGRKTVVKSL